MAEGQSTRWNPRSEQIALLEATYCQGMRTPNGDQTEQIVNRLRMYGNIEGKNVYYWFRNRRARESQRQKRERMASINHFLQPPSLAATSHTNSENLCDTSFNLRNRKARKSRRQKRERMAFLNQFLQPPSLAVTSHTNTLLPEVSSPEQKSAAVVMPKIHVTSTDHDNQTRNADNLCEPPTLELFPLHPTGMARANPQSVQEPRNDSRSHEYIHEQNDPRPGWGHYHSFFHFIPRHPGK